MNTRLNQLTVFFVAIILLPIITLNQQGKFHNFHWHNQHNVASHPLVIVDIGAYPNLKAEQRAAIQRLSVELFQHPETSAVTITGGKSAWRNGVMGFVRIAQFKQNNNLFWFDSRFSSPDFGIVKGRLQGISAYRPVSEEPIHVAAHKNGGIA